ncbi:MAG: ABC transporter ATP-binding protein [Kiritimatiellia bacterium]
MNEPAISIRHLSKRYRLGAIGRHTLVDEAQYFWHKLRGRDPRTYLGKIGHGATEKRKTDAEREGSREFWALNDVSFDVQPGEVVGIVGRNGAGKSTLLKLLTRITEPTAGEVVLNGRAASLLEVGTGFHPELTGRENVYMNGTILGMKKREIDAKFDEIVAFSELAKFIDTPVKRYSSGMYVRLAFSVAAHLEPEILLVDEVLAVGDASFQKKCLGKMGDVAKEGRTILFVSHNMVAVEALCPRCAVIRDGTLEFIGAAAEGISRYLRAAAGPAAAELADRAEDRKGNGAARLLRLSVAGRDRALKNAVACGDDAEFRWSYRVERPLVGGALHFTVYGPHGQAICTFESGARHFALDGRPGEHEIRCRVERFNLAPGEYTVNVGLADATGLADGVAAAGAFTVLPGDVQNTGKQVSSQYGVVVFAADWKTEGGP